jgi:phenylalanine ammonia-lyase
VWTAATMRRLLESSGFVWPTIDDIPSADSLIQDRYSIRCLPQFIGPIVEAMDSAQGQLETEMNAASDNPLIGDGARYHAGNFLAQVPALAMDHLRQHLGLLAKHLDVQVSLVMSPEFSRGLPASLVGNTEKHSNLGLKGLQLTGNSLMPLLTFYGNTFVDRFATHAEQYNQNINSLSYSAALLARESIRLYRLYVSIALVIAVQAVDLRAAVRTGSHDPRPLLAPATRRLYEAMRAVLGCPIDASRPLVRNDDEQQLDALVASVTRELEDGGRILGAVQPYAPSSRTR